MKNKILYTLLLLGLIVCNSFSQKNYLADLEIKNVQVHKMGYELNVQFDLSMDQLSLRSNDMLILTPMIRPFQKASDVQDVSLTMEEQDELSAILLDPIRIAGSKKDIALRRAVLTKHRDKEVLEQNYMVYHSKKMEQSYHYTMTVPYDSSMNHSTLLVMATSEGCAECLNDLGETSLMELNLAPYKPKYMLTYIMPEAEPIKARADKHSASFNFVVGRHELRRDFKDNARELDRVDKVMEDVLSNKDINVTEFAIIGYASPEGGYESNRQLSERRAYAFAEYLSNEHGVKKSQVKVTGHGEDWDGLTKAIEASSLEKRTELLELIEKISNPDARDSQIRSLDNGRTYRTLIEDFYPALRRTDYFIAYNVRAFNVEEAKEIVKTNPKLLSLNEMYLVAQTYEPTSREFKEVFDIAARLYPDEPIAIINASAADIEGGNMKAAVDRMTKISSDARVWNNLGVAYARLGDYDSARSYFERAMAQDDKMAEHNLAELDKLMSQK